MSDMGKLAVKATELIRKHVLRGNVEGFIGVTVEDKSLTITAASNRIEEIRSGWEKYLKTIPLHSLNTVPFSVKADPDEAFKLARGYADIEARRRGEGPRYYNYTLD